MAFDAAATEYHNLQDEIASKTHDAQMLRDEIQVIQDETDARGELEGFAQAAQ